MPARRKTIGAPPRKNHHHDVRRGGDTEPASGCEQDGGAPERGREAIAGRYPRVPLLRLIGKSLVQVAPMGLRDLLAAPQPAAQRPGGVEEQGKQGQKHDDERRVVAKPDEQGGYKGEDR